VLVTASLAQGLGRDLLMTASLGRHCFLLYIYLASMHVTTIYQWKICLA